MRPDSTDAAYAAVRAADTDGLSRDGCAEVMAHMQRVRSALDATEVRIVRRLRQLQIDGASEDPDAIIARGGHRSGREARAVTERDAVCDEIPAVEHALEVGALSGSHVDALTAAMKPLPHEIREEFGASGDELVARAGHVSLETFQRECRQLAAHLLTRSRGGSDADELEAQRTASKVSRWVDQTTGMHHTKLELDPVRDAKLNATINRALARLRQINGNAQTPWQQLQVEALLDAVECGDTHPDHAGRSVDRVPEITVVVSWDWLTGRVEEPEVCETENGAPLPVSTVRRLCCDAEILPVVLGGDSEVLDAGRSRRTASRGQRRALRAIHRGCAHPGCTVGFDSCRIHHVSWWWEHNGATDIDNLVPLCERHHHDVHEGGWQLTMTPDRVATWVRPDGTTFYTGPTTDRFLQGLGGAVTSGEAR